MGRTQPHGIAGQHSAAQPSDFWCSPPYVSLSLPGPPAKSSTPIFVVADSFPTVKLFPLDWGPEFSFPLAPWCLSFRCRSSERTPAGSVSRVFFHPRLKIVCMGAAAQPPGFFGAEFGLPLAFGARVLSLALGATNGLPLAGFGVSVVAELPL